MFNFLDTRQDSNCDITMCVFAYLLKKMRKLKTLSHESAFQCHNFLFVFGVLFILRN